MSNIKPQEVHGVLSKYMLADGMEFVVDLDRSHGCYLNDLNTGKEYLDFFTFFASLPIGFNHPDLMTKEFKEKLARASVNKPSNSDLYTVEMAEFVETFFRVAVKSTDLKHLFFVDGGGLAVENALKTAMDWKVRKNFAKGLKTEKGHKIIHFQEAFHGRTGYTLSLTNTADPRKYMYFAKFDWPRVLNPKVKFPLNEINLADVKRKEEECIAQIKNILAQDKDDIAAFIMEPIQGEGGDNHFRPEFVKQIRALADENDFLLIFDEVQTGMGLTGKWWAYEYFGVPADIIAFGKKSQTCGIAASKRVEEVEKNVFAESSRLNSTWGGNLTDMVRAKKYLEVIEKEKLVENAANMGKYMTDSLLALGTKYPKITNIRGKGLMIAFDFETSEIRNKAVDEIKNNGVLVLPCGNRSIRLRPALNVAKKECDQALTAFENAFKAV